MSPKARFVLILTATITFYSVLVLLLLSLRSRIGSIANVAFPILLAFGVAPIYPLLRTLRKRSRLSAARDCVGNHRVGVSCWDPGSQTR